MIILLRITAYYLCLAFNKSLELLQIEPFFEGESKMIAY